MYLTRILKDILELVLSTLRLMLLVLALIDWDKGTFQDDYGRGTLPSRLYDGFQYKPDYISDEFPADLFNGKFRNRFTRPDYEIKEGEWNTIKAALQHAFQDQYELILKMCAVMLKWPETNSDYLS